MAVEDLTYYFVALVLLIAGLAGIAISAPRRLWMRASSVLLAGVCMAVAYAALADLLGQPKPLALEWRGEAVVDAEVLSASIREDVGIYLWLQIQGRAEPQSYRLPWDQELAVSLQSVQRGAAQQGTAVRMRLADEPADDENPVFYAPPQPAPPLKATERQLLHDETPK